jgi:DNA (cytosine-5)-methyltransferase 1
MVQKIQKNFLKKLQVATVFSGIGAFEHALDRIGVEHEIIFACDIDNYCKKTYFANYKINENKWYSDIFDIDGKKYNGNLDILVGGSPCQSFSMVGKRRGLEDERGNLIFEFIRIVRESCPKVFIFENVKGLLSHNKGET